ncbi:T6SS immunity protein Tdi1 domain-containing protein [Actinoplanes utahensis]
MFDRLIRAFPVTARERIQVPPYSVPRLLRSCFEEMGGSTLAAGFLRFHSPSSAEASTIRCATLIEGFGGRFYCFSVDWLGRELAVDLRKPGADVILVDPGGAEYLDPETSLFQWHDVVASDDDPLAYPFYKEWREANANVGPLGFNQCIGYSVPLFLGGQDEVGNLALIDREFYFETCTQLAKGARSLPPGATIESIAESDR